MKRVILCVSVLCLITLSAQSQSNKKKTSSKKQTAKTAQSKKATKPKATSANTVTLTSASSNTAKSSSTSPGSFRISDPILTTLDARASGANVSISKSGVVGMPKRAYGFANGHILLRTTGSTTFGTQTGSGAVGTGTSLGTFGSIGPSIPVNGKSPYAGINMWGNATNMNLSRPDSSARKGSGKQ